MLDGAGNYNPYQADVYSLAWAHYDMLNPKLLLEHQDKRVTLMSNVRNAAARGSWKDVATALKAEFATTSMTSKDFPKAWLDTKVIAQGLMAEGKRISTQQYYKGFCDIRQIPCNSNSDSWNAGGNTVGSNYQPN